MRTALVCLVTFFALAPAAQAWPTLSARFREITVTPFMSSAMETPRAGGVGSAINQTPAGLPVLVAPSHGAMGLTFSRPADSVTANVGGQTVAATRDSDREFTLVLPDYPPGDVGFVVAYSTADVTGRAEYHLTLNTQPPYVSTLRLVGSRLRAKVLCTGPCTGRITVRTPAGHRIARLELARAGWTSAQLRPATRRYLKRHAITRLRVYTSSAGAPLQRGTLNLET